MRHSWAYGKTSRQGTWLANEVVAAAERSETITGTGAFDPKQTLAGSNLTRRLSVNWRVPGPHRAPGELVLHR